MRLSFPIQSSDGEQVDGYQPAGFWIGVPVRGGTLQSLSQGHKAGNACAWAQASGASCSCSHFEGACSILIVWGRWGQWCMTGPVLAEGQQHLCPTKQRGTPSLAEAWEPILHCHAHLSPATLAMDPARCPAPSLGLSLLPPGSALIGGRVLYRMDV